MINIFIQNEVQSEWLSKIQALEVEFKNRSLLVDELAMFPKENIQDLIKAGYTKTSLPKEFGGYGLRLYDLLLLQETIASYDSATALSIGWHIKGVGEIFENKNWSDKTLQFFAKEVQNGALVNHAFSEAQTGSPTRGGQPNTIAEKNGDSWMINGRKTFTTMSPALTYFIVSAWIEEKQTIGYFLLHKDLKGVAIDETWDVISMRGTGSHDLVLENVVVQEEMLVEWCDSPKSTKSTGWMLHIPACYLGIAQAARDYAIDFANNHSPNSITGTISQLPNIQNLIGQIDLELMKARHFLYSVAEIFDDEMRLQLLSNEIGAVKHTVTNAAISVVDKAMRIVGAKSLQTKNPLQRYYRDVRSGLHNPPMDDVTIQKIAVTAIDSINTHKIITK